MIMGKPERKARERTCSSSSSYLLRCFGISWKIHSDKPILDAVHQETQKMKKKKKKTTTRWFSPRPLNFRLKNGEITSTEKQNLIVEDDDDKQNLFCVIRHVTDPKNNNIATSGFIKSVDEHESNTKDTNGERDINPDPLSFLGYDTCYGGKLDPTKAIGSDSKPKELREKSSRSRSRVRKGSRVGSFDQIIGISIITLTLIIMLIWGRLCAILCTSTWCYFLPRLKEAANAVAKAKRKRKRTSGGKVKDDGSSSPGDLDLNSEAYKKKVVLQGFLVRQHHVLL